jgi:archaellum component FlaD/FlaE
MKLEECYSVKSTKEKPELSTTILLRDHISSLVFYERQRSSKY